MFCHSIVRLCGNIKLSSELKSLYLTMNSESDEIDMIMSEMESETKEVQAPIPKPRQLRQVPDDVDGKSMGIIR